MKNGTQPHFTYILAYNFQTPTIIYCSVLKKTASHQGLPVYLSMALQPFVEPWPLFKFLDLLQSQYGSLDGGSAHRKAATCTQDSTNIE
jgi:hypothetical protein